MNTKYVLLIGIAALLGCTTTACFAQADMSVRLHLSSSPEGAAIVQNGKVLGVTPTVIHYAVTKHWDDQTACKSVAPLTARWPDGTRATSHGKLCPRYGHDVSHRFVHPANKVAQVRTSNLSLAQQRAAIQRTKARIQALERAQANAALDRSIIQAAGTLGEVAGGALSGHPWTPYAPIVPLPTYPAPTNNKRVTCTSRANGGFNKMVTTTCH